MYTERAKRQVFYRRDTLRGRITMVDEDGGALRLEGFTQTFLLPETSTRTLPPVGTLVEMEVSRGCLIHRLRTYRVKP